MIDKKKQIIVEGMERSNENKTKLLVKPQSNY